MSGKLGVYLLCSLNEEKEVRLELWLGKMISKRR